MQNKELKKLVYTYLYENYNKDIIDYLRSRTKVLDIDTKNGMPYFACFSNLTNDILSGVTIIVPGMYDIKSMRINIHEYKHGIDYYSYLNKKLPDESPRETFNMEIRAIREEYEFLDYIKTKALKK